MNNSDYQHYFKSVLNTVAPAAPYDDPDYMNYTRLNWFRQQRWLKSGELNEELTAFVANIGEYQKWVFITEPWCGDAPHVLPFILKLLAGNSIVELDIQLRDKAPFAINQYLSGQSKSIPKLVVRDALNHDLFVWGPRPKECQKLYNELKIVDAKYEQVHIELQNWYNLDKGASFQKEILAEFKNTTRNAPGTS